MTKPVKKPWSIVGAGPSGAMQAVVLAALFPDQEIYVLDKYREQVRGYGLQFQNETSQQCANVLNQVKTQIIRTLKSRGLSPQDKAHYQTILQNIDKTKKFLKKNFTGFLTAPFVRTHVISDLLREFAEHGLQNNNVKFMMHNEVTTKQLEALRDGHTPDLKTDEEIETYACLEKSSFIFGADGAQSKVRDVIFRETNNDLNKETMAHVIEVKLEMKDGADPLDFMKRSLYPSLINGHLHVWNHSKSGTATLHIFVEEEQYKIMRGKKYKGRNLGEFTNPYRRLIDLPEELVKPIQQSITDIIGVGNFDENSIKITSLPIATYVARQLICEANGRSYGLVGDSAVGLVLERGMNNGIYSTIEYGKALFQRDLEMRSAKDTNYVSTNGKFKVGHFIDLLFFLKNLRVDFNISDETAKIIELKYEKCFEKIMESNYKLKHKHEAFVIEQEMKFLEQVSKLLPKELVKQIPIRAPNLFNDLKKKNIVDKNKKNALDYCEDKIKSRAAKVINQIQFKFGFINFIKHLYGKMVSLYFNFKQKHFNTHYVSITDQPLQTKYEELKKNIPKYDIVDHRVNYMKSAEWTFNMDMICLALQEKIARLHRQSQPDQKKVDALAATLDATMEFSAQITQFINSNSSDVRQMNTIIQAWEKRITSSHLLNRDLIAPALTSCWKLTVSINDVTENVLAGFNKFLYDYENNRYKHKLGLFGRSADMKVKSYQWLFDNKNITINTKLCIIYSLLKDENNKQLRQQILKFFPEKAHINLADVQDEILKIIKMDVPVAKSREFSSGLAELKKCVARNAFPTATMTNKLDDVFAPASKPSATSRTSP